MNRNRDTENKTAHHLRTLVLIALSALTSIAEAAPLNLLDTPLYLSTPVGPNVVLTFDDSGSMNWAFLGDEVGFGDADPTHNNPSGLRTKPRGCAHNINKVYYDPSITYYPPIKADGTSWPNANFTSAYYNGYDTTSATTNLATSYKPKWDPTGIWASTTATCGLTTPTPAFYYSYDSSCGNPYNDACYTLKQFDATWSAADQQNFANWYSYYSTRNLMAKTAAGRAFANFPTTIRVAGQHINNTSNSTTRFTKTIGTMQQFCDNSSGTVAGCPSGSIARTDFYTRLYNSPASGGTPLISAMQRAKTYFMSTSNGAYRDNPSGGTTNNPERSCRQNFQIMMTDGYWNGGVGTSVGDVDGANQTLGDNSSYTVPRPPYNDSGSATPSSTNSWSDTLADNSFNAWYQDLRPTGTGSLANNVPPHWGEPTHDIWNPVNDPATWQHLVTFTIGLGIDGTLTKDTATYNNLVSGATAWPQPCDGCGPENIDDLWHAALNSRGQYFSAGNPQALSAAFTTIVQNVVDRLSSASTVTLNASTLTGNNYVYQARFNSGTWSGQLLAYHIDSTTGDVNGTPSWDAAAKLNDANYASNLYNNRVVLTYKPSGNAGIPFRWPSNPSSPASTELDVSQSTALNLNPNTNLADTQGSARLDYIRGDASNEGSGNGYPSRTRMCGATTCTSNPNTGWLGDTINSAPIYVGVPPMGYPDTLETKSYSTFQSDNASREPIVYVGANDGMLHGFDANTGIEKLAYVPSSVYGNLSALTATPYSHRYYVDGNPVPGDVFITPLAPPLTGSSPEWRTILVGGLRKGGQGIYALDVTDPSSFSETNAGNLALWEFTDKNDSDLGYTFGEPVIAKMQNGKWAVILSNGYNNTQADGAASTSGHAVLYILFIQAGIGGWTSSGYVKIDTGAGTTTTPNGLAAPAAVDVNGDNLVDYIYAGDLQGNMWKFDVSSTNTSNWTSASNRSVVYVAKDSANNLQPITTRPQIGRMPAGQPGYMVYFGTGRYLDSADASTATSSGVQTFYGIWDSSGVNNPTRSSLLQQTVVSTQTVNGADYRVISNNPMVWKIGSPAPSPSYIGWYIDLPTSGERNVTDSILRDGRIIFTTLIPSSDPCTAGGDGWLMELDAVSGGRLDTTPFDVNGDDTFNTTDNLTITSGASTVKVPAGGQHIAGIPSSPAILSGGNPAQSPACTGAKCQEQKLISNSDGSIKSVAENPENCNYCRASWRQIR